MRRIFVSLSVILAAQAAMAAPIATAESFGYSGGDAAKYNRMVAGFASANCGKLNETIGAALKASAGNDAAIRQNAARAVAKAKGC